MKIAFRVDASPAIGSGHFMRCLTLADALAKQKAEIIFVCRALPDALSEMLHSRQYGLALLPEAEKIVEHHDLAHAGWLASSQKQDAQDTARALKDDKCDWLVVDHYALDERWEVLLHPCVSNLFVIDDLADRRHECDALLDQNLYGEMGSRYHKLLPESAEVFLGPAYALLRDEFRQARLKMSVRRAGIRKLLVMFGGADAENLTGRAVQILARMDLPGVTIDVVVSRQHPQREKVGEVCNQQKFGFHEQPEHLASLMLEADLAIAAGGVSLWERCCVGLPALVICAAQNQRQQIDDAIREGLVVAAAAPDDMEIFLRKQIPLLLEDASCCQQISLNGMRMVDGLGAARIAAYMRGSLIRIRQATLQDATQIFEWRNHPLVRAASRNDNELEYDEHLAWYMSVLKNPNRPILIGEIEGEAVGVVRFDIADGQAEVSIYLVQQPENSGLGKSLLNHAEKWLKHYRSQVRCINAIILAGNEKSENLFYRSGYRKAGGIMTKEICEQG